MSTFESTVDPRPTSVKYDQMHHHYYHHHHHESQPTEPESSDSSSNHHHLQPPSPPRPRFRLKRRIASTLIAPTRQFLASVAAADVPIPSIEEPDQSFLNDTDMPELPPSPNLSLLSLPSDTPALGLGFRGRTTSPPRTPAPGAAQSLSPKRYPDWSFGASFSSSDSSSECDSSRPSTARSTQTSASLFSRCSLIGDDRQFLASDLEHDHEPFKTSEPSESSEPFPSLSANSVASPSVTSRPALSSNRKQRRAPWTKAMSQHLWSTYLLYLQDPRVTPFRFGKSCIPPHGVCVRIAREACRSWKGSRPHAHHPPRNAGADKSGSSTPTADGAATYIRWPHTCAATRAHLHELCRANARASSTAPSGARDKLLSRSPPPAPPAFGSRAAPRHHGNRRSTPLRSQLRSNSDSGFGRDMAMSLALSTSDALQPGGPLALLTSSALHPDGHRLSIQLEHPQPHPVHGHPLPLLAPTTTATATGPAPAPAPIPAPAPQSTSTPDRPASPPLPLPTRFQYLSEPDNPMLDLLAPRRLGSPFTARSYGPSSSGTLDPTLALLASDLGRQTHTVGLPHRSLQSPVQLTRSRSNTQKRRPRQPSNEARRSKRPSLSSDFWTNPATGPSIAPSTPQPPAVDLAAAALVPAPALRPQPSSSPPLNDSFITVSRPSRAGRMFRPRALTSLIGDYHVVPTSSSLSSAARTSDLPPRLGSPFSGSSSSFSVPNRYSVPSNTNAGVGSSLGLRATTTTTTTTATTTTATLGDNPLPAQRNLASRLAYVDLRLRELRQNHQLRQRSESPI